MPESIRALYESHRRQRTRPSFTEILQALDSVAALYSRSFLIVDALDECDDSGGNRQKFVSAILSLQGKTGINLFATSRINEHVATLFKSALSLEIRANEDDVRIYLDGQMSLLQPDILDYNIQDNIRREVVRAADGM